MSLMEDILHRVDDRERVIERMERSPALKQLVEDYQKYTRDDATLHNITMFTTGADLKMAIRRLEPDTQLTLLKKYSDTIRGVVHGEPLGQVEERRTRHWLIKLFGVVASSILLIMVTAVVSAMFRTNTTANTSVTTSIFSTIGEIVKLILLGTK